MKPLEWLIKERNGGKGEDKWEKQEGKPSSLEIEPVLQTQLSLWSEWKVVGGLWPKPQSLILIKDIKERPQSLSVWSARNPVILKFPGAIHSQDLRKAWGSGDTCTGGLEDIKGQWKVCALWLAAVALMGKNWEQSGSCGSRTAAQRT